MSIRKLHKKSLNKAVEGRDFRYRPRYMPLNYGMEAGNVNIGDAFNVLKSGFQDFFGGKDTDGDGFKDGIFRDMKGKREFRKNVVVPRMYDYKVMYDDDTTPGTYEYDAKDLFEASKFGKRLLGKNTIDPTGQLNYSNDPDDPTNTFYTDSTITFKNRDSMNAPDGLTTLRPSVLKTLTDATTTIMGLPPMQEQPKDNKIKDALDGVGSAISDVSDIVTSGVDKLGNKMEDVFNDLIEKGEITIEDIKNRSENFYDKMRTFYETDIKSKLNPKLFKFQKKGEVNETNTRSYDQRRLLEIQEEINKGNLTDEQKKNLFAELTNIDIEENRFLNQFRNDISLLDDRLEEGSLPTRESSKYTDAQDNPAKIQGAGFLSKPMFNYLENTGYACNTYACSILRDAGATYPIDMEPIVINNRTYRGGDKVAVIPGNQQQDGIYNYKSGNEGFKFVNVENPGDEMAGDYARIGYPFTNHAVLYTGDETNPGESIYNPGYVGEGLRTGTGFMPTDEDIKVVRYTGNTDLINNLLMQVDDGQTKVAGKSDVGIPKGQYGFNFQGTPLPVMETFPIMEEQTTMVPNPDFNFMSLLSPQTDLASTMQNMQDLELQQRFPDLGPTPAQQQQSVQPFIENTEMVQVGEEERQVGIENPAAPEVQGAKVKRDFGKGLEGLKNRAFTALNRLESSVPFQIFEKGSDFAVGAASVLNDMFQSKKVAEAEEEMRRLNMADNMFGTSERTDRGLYDTNTGLLMPDLSVTTSYAEHGGEVEVDDITLKQLMAAGADIEIIE